METQLAQHEKTALIRGEYATPYNILGMHEITHPDGVIVRAFIPEANHVKLVDLAKEQELDMFRLHHDGLFDIVLENRKPFPYRLRVYEDNQDRVIDDPYRFPLQITDFDMHLFGEGTHYRTYEKMGAHLTAIDGVDGVHFAVWAPNAQRVSVIGQFNRWDGRSHPMQRRNNSGLWEMFIPDLKQGDIYKYEINGSNDYINEKSDPYAFFAEQRPKSASVVWDMHDYTWNDQAWMQTRREKNWLCEPISIYELHLGSWRRNPSDNRWLTYREMARDLIPYVKDMGFTHIELLPISEHPFDGSWGYQTIGYFAITSRYGTPEDFKYFIECCHQQGIGVIIDWVPAHFPRDGHGLAYFDGTHLYEHRDPKEGEHKDWGTLIFNYGRNEVRTFLLSNAVFWADIYHIDGMRVDAVASMLYRDYSRKPGEWVPNKYGGRENLEAVSFLKKFNEVIYGEFPGFITFAEESTSWPMVSRPTYLGGLGFGFKWNMGWMHDMLQYTSKDPVYRKYHHNDLTFSLLYAFNENFILPFSHDEVVHGKRTMLDKMPGDPWQKFANLRLLYSYMYAHPGKKLLFMGSEWGVWKEWFYDESLDWDLLQYESHHKLQHAVRTLNHIYQEYPCLHEIDCSWNGFQWVEIHDSEQSTLSFMRKSDQCKDILICAFNYTPVPRYGYRLGVPFPGRYHEVYNSDGEEFGGGNVRNTQEIWADEVPWQSQPFSIVITIPPLGAVYFKPEIIPEPEPKVEEEEVDVEESAQEQAPAIEKARADDEKKSKINCEKG